jgi:hypothetical protein
MTNFARLIECNNKIAIITDFKDHAKQSGKGIYRIHYPVFNFSALCTSATSVALSESCNLQKA